MLTAEEIKSLRDEDLMKWAKKLKEAGNSGSFRSYPNPRRAAWCYYEARRELVRRKIKNYHVRTLEEADVICVRKIMEE